MGTYRNRQGSVLSIDEETTSGTTGASYVAVVAWECADIGEKVLLLKNESASNTLYYKLEGKFSSSGNLQIIVSETSLAAGALAEFRYKHYWQTLVLSVKNNSGGCDYQVEWGGVPLE